MKKLGEKVLKTELKWETEYETFLNVACAMDEDCRSKSVLQALAEFKKESDLSWLKPRKKKNM